MRPTPFVTGWMLAAAILACVTLSGCHKNKGPAEASQASTSVGEQVAAPVMRAKALAAVQDAAVKIDGIITASADQSLSASDVVAKVLPMLDSAGGGSGINFRYVADHATGPMQVVIRADGRNVQIEAYGTDTGEALEKRTITLP